MYIIRRRSNNQIVERGFKTREDAKPNRDIYNNKYYKTGVPERNREFYVTKCPVNHPKMQLKKVQKSNKKKVQKQMNVKKNSK